MEVRDPIHGLIEYDEIEEKIINSSLFQRLRGIKQAALTSLVYPGAHHTRFEHSIGTMHLAGKIANRLKLKKNISRILRLAGLLHDIGHGPFSHVSEQIIEKRVAEEALKRYKAENVHEMLSILLIMKNGEIKEILNSEEIEAIISLLQKQEKGSVNKDIISGPLDVDKLDYLLRDSHFAGVKYGVFDLDKVVESLIPIHVSREASQLGIHEEGVHAVEQMLLAKYHMNTQVYQHRIRRIADAMITRGIEHALKEGVTEIKRLYDFIDTGDFLNKYLQYDDNKLISVILSAGKELSQEYFKRITRRQLFKEVFFIEINDRNFPDAILLDNVRNISGEKISQIEKEIVNIFSSLGIIDHNFVIVDKQSFINPTFKSPRIKIDTSTIMVALKEKRREVFFEVSAIFSNRAIDPEKEILYIYCPLDNIEKKDRTKLIAEKRNEILNMIKEVLK